MRVNTIGKIRSTRGETITETLVSLLVIVLAMTMLAGSIVSAARVNRKVKDYNTAFQSDSVTTSPGTVTIKHTKAAPDDPVDVTVSKTDDNNEYIYYEKK